MDLFVEHLAELCSVHPTRTKWVVTPSHGLGRTLGERLAVGGTSWLNLRFVTPLDIALRMAAPFLVEQGIDPSEEGLGPALMMRLLLDLPEDDGYFRPLVDHPTLAQALWSATRELRMAGLSAADLRQEDFMSDRKGRELRLLLGAYEEFLQRTRRADMAMVYAEALKHQAWCPIQSADCWIDMPGAAWSTVQRRLLDALPGERLVPRMVQLPGSEVPRRLKETAINWTSPEPARFPLAQLKNGFAPPNAPIGLFHAGGRESEIDEVVRRILLTGAPLDQVEIACGSDEHHGLVWEKALRHEWPVTLGNGLPAAQTRPGRALIGFCDWIETDFAAGHFRRLLQSGDLGVEVDDEGFTAGQAAGILARAGAAWGRETYALALGRLAKQYSARADNAEAPNDEREVAKERAARIQRVCEWITGLVNAVPAADTSGQVPIQRVVDAAVAFLTRTTARKSALDHRAATSLIDHVSQLRALGTFSCSLSQTLRFIRERVLGLRVAPERPRPGHLHVSPLAQACYAGRPHLFVVGLEEGRVFPSSSEDAVLLDTERAVLSQALQRSTDRIDEAVHSVLTRLASWTPGAHGTVTFSYSCRDTREFRETYASWLMLAAFRAQQGDPSASYPAMKTALGEPVSRMPADRGSSSNSSGWWLRTVVGTGNAGAATIETVFAGLQRAGHAMQRKRSEDFTEFDGHVPEAGAVLDLCRPDSVWSVTELENAAACPFRFFLKRGLGVRPVEERARDRDVWLDPLMRGAALHDLFASLLRRTRAAGRKPSPAEDRGWFRQCGQAMLDDIRKEFPPATDEILARESSDFLADLDLFLEAEAAGEGSTPIALEVAFGRAADDGEEPLAQEDPVRVDLGEGLGFYIVGRIDRIDQVAPSSFEIVDYKTGGFWPAEGTGKFKGGRRLQHALYGLAATQLLRKVYRRPKVAAGVYYFPSYRGRGKRVSIPAPTLAQTSSVLGDLREVIRAGHFAHAAGKEDCQWCDFNRACDGPLIGESAPKLAGQPLAVYRRLRAHD
jgi:ATP-dependent helicase/nuclease subunit B